MPSPHTHPIPVHLPLSPTPFAAFEAREFLRKKLIGKKVQVTIDYIKEANEGFPAKTCATVKIGDANIAEAMISKGLAGCLRHGQNDDSRSSAYDDLMAAETRAKKAGKGIHSDKPTPLTRIADVRSKELGERFFPSLQRAGRFTGVVEHVMNGARFRIYVPKETALITFALAGLSCPRPGRQDTPDEPGCNEAIAFARRRCMQHEVELRVEASDKSGCMIGHLYCDGENLAEALVAAGLSKLHFTADRYANYNAMAALEATAMKNRLGVWADYKVSTVAVVAGDVCLFVYWRGPPTPTPILTPPPTAHAGCDTTQVDTPNLFFLYRNQRRKNSLPRLPAPTRRASRTARPPSPTSSSATSTQPRRCGRNPRMARRHSPR